MQRETGQVERMGSWLHPCGRSLKRGAALLLLVVLAPLAMALSDLSAPQKPTYEIAPQELEELSPVVYKESYGRSGPIVFNHQSALW